MYPFTPIMHIVLWPLPKPNLCSLFFLLDDRGSLDSPVFEEIETLATLRFVVSEWELVMSRVVDGPIHS